MICGCTKMKKKRRKDCRAPENRGRMRNWLGCHHETYQSGQTGKRLKGKRRCRKSLSCRMRWKALFVDLDGESFQEEQLGKASENVEVVRGS